MQSEYHRRLKQKYARRISAELAIPASAGVYCDFPQALDARLCQALAQRGIGQLYSHQLKAWDYITAGRHTVVVTPTASGKTLCYNLPVLQAAINEQAKALYLFPTKALAQDQVAELLELNTAGNLGVRAFTFDGDTPADARQAVRLHGDIVVSNPDMLHQGILPHHTKWAQFFEALRYVVIDEMHTYRGVFGSHMANVIRRLLRVCRFYRSQPMFIFCSATIANPAELAAAAARTAGHGDYRQRCAPGRKAPAAVESAGDQSRPGAARLGPLADHAPRACRDQGGSQDHRFRQHAADGRSPYQVFKGRLRP